MHSIPPRKRYRRTATAVMAGNFDVPPPRDVLTSLLNGVGPYHLVEKDAEERRQRKKEKREKRKARALDHTSMDTASATTVRAAAPATTVSISVPPLVNPKAASFWKSKPITVPNARPEIMIASTQRSVSVTPPPAMLSPQPTPECTPGPSVSSSMSHDRHRLHTPDDYEDINSTGFRHISGPTREKRERRKRPAVRKGWKGWVEGSPPPSEKLINLDAVPLLRERRTRSGKNFDAIGVGKEGWI